MERSETARYSGTTISVGPSSEYLNMACSAVASMFHCRIPRSLADRQQDYRSTCHSKSERQSPFYCHPKEKDDVVYVHHLIRAAKLYETIETIPRGNDVWAAIRAFSAALTSHFADYRYPLFWQGLESLFGDINDTPGISRRLRDRISFFLADDNVMQQQLCDEVKACYKTRSEIVHGRWYDGQEMDNRMGQTEAIVRTVLRHIIEMPGMLGAFLSPKREAFLESWLKSKAFTAPPFPPSRYRARPLGKAGILGTFSNLFSVTYTFH